MEIVMGIFGIGFVALALYFMFGETESQRVFKKKNEERIREIQVERARAASAAFERQRTTTRSAPITTGKPATAPVTTRVAATKAPEVKRHDNSFENVVDSYQAPTYHSSHSTNSYSSGSCSSSSSSSDSSSSSSDSGSSGGGCD